MTAAYREWRPRLLPAHAVRCAWSHDGLTSGPRTIAPDNCADILITLDPDGGWESAWVVGTMSRPLMLPAGRYGAVTGWRFAPGWLPSMLGIPGCTLRDLKVPLGDVAPGLERRLHAATGAAGLDGAHAIVAAELCATVPPPAVVRRAVEVLSRSRGATRIGALARSLGVSRQHLARTFDDSLGVSPKFAARVIRMEHVVAASRNARGAWARAAADAGYSDQAHLANEVRSLTGQSLTNLIA